MKYEEFEKLSNAEIVAQWIEKLGDGEVNYFKNGYIEHVSEYNPYEMEREVAGMHLKLEPKELLYLAIKFPNFIYGDDE